MTAVAFDPTTLGTDLNIGISDVPGVWGLASGLANLGNALLRRWTTPPGGLFYDDDYGFDLFGLLNQNLDAPAIAAAQGDMSSQAEKDERIDTCAVAMQLDAATEELFIFASGVLVTGQPFAFVMRAADATVDLLAINGVSVAAAVTGLPAAPGVQLVVGPPGPAGATTAGVPGPPGPAGTAQVSMDFDDDIGADDTGAEVVVHQRLVNFASLGTNVTFELSANVYSASGTATFRVSYGGTSRVADGTNVGSPITTGSATPVAALKTDTIANPGGQRLVKITVQSSGAGVDAGIPDRVLTIR